MKFFLSPLYRVLPFLILLLTTLLVKAQNQENFENIPIGSTAFTNAGQTFSIGSQSGGTFKVFSDIGYGWNGTGPDDRFVDNTGSATQTIGVQFTISSTSSFRMQSLWLYLSNASLDVNVNGTLSITGKLGGTTVFTANSTANFNNKSFGVANGFTQINFASFGGSDNTAKSINELVITTTNPFNYVALDAFRWTSAGTAPTVTTTAASVIGGTSAVLGGSVTSAGTATVTERGIVWGTAANPTTANNKVANGSGTGSFSARIGSLPSSTLINYRAYATSTAGTSYGNNLTFTTNAALSIPGTSSTNVTCNGSCNGSATVSPAGGAGSYTYSWSPSGGIAATASNLCAGSYTCTVTDAAGASVQKTVIITQPAPIAAPTISSNSPVCPGATINLTASQVSGATYNWTGPNSFSSSQQNPTLTDVRFNNGGTYALTVAVNGCTSSARTIAVTVTTPSQFGGVAGTPGSVSEQTQNVSASSGNYNDAGCNRISTVLPSGANPVSGNVTTKVWVNNGVPTAGGIPFVARHYEITPATNPSTATGTVRLYFLQSEFDAFNNTGVPLKLPTGPSDAAGKSNIRIGKYSGTSSDNSGLPGSYTGTATVIDPADIQIIWNAFENRWEVEFDVSGFSGFILQSQTSVLPVKLQSFTATPLEGIVKLDWTTASEINTRSFIIEKSDDGKKFNSIGSVQAAGNSSGVLAYSFADSKPAQLAFYRLKMFDRDGSFSFSNVTEVKIAGTTKPSLFPNPAIDVLYLKNAGKAKSAIIIYDLTGRVVNKINSASPVNGILRIDVSSLSSGTYFISADAGLIKFVKK